jgi:ADP-ribose pyrophosphatase YjhB (NUDIX family)
VLPDQPIVYAAGPRKRPFATSAVALQAIIVNHREEILLLSSPTRNKENEWQVVSGALDAGETILGGTLRETWEETGAALQVRPLGVVHSETFHYDQNVRFMIGIYYLLAYEGGEVQPGDDMDGSQYRWWSLAELAEQGLRYHPSTKPWMLERAVALYRLWKDQHVPLQPQLEATVAGR